MINQTKEYNKVPTYLILGYPRSGTTWFANLFNTHPDVIYRHEVIGRCHKSFPLELFQKLKFDSSLNDIDYESAINIILSPNIESDRAPFFKKNHLIFSNPRFHYLSWIASKTISVISPLYKIMFTPHGKDKIIVIKETRSTINMDSIIKGIRSDKNIILFRHPCGAIASSLAGIETGKMMPSSIEEREFWFNENKENDYIIKLNLNPSQIKELPEHEYLALRWRLQNEDYLNFSLQNENNIYINYENFMQDQNNKVEELFNKISLSFDLNVKNFLLASSGSNSKKPILKDSSSSFYSVYRSKDFDPNKWQKSLLAEQISSIEKHTLDIFKTLLNFSNK